MFLKGILLQSLNLSSESPLSIHHLTSMAISSLTCSASISSRNRFQDLNPEHPAPSLLPRFMFSKGRNALVVPLLVMLFHCASCVHLLISFLAFTKLPIEVLLIETVPATAPNFFLTSILTKRFFGHSIIRLMEINSSMACILRKMYTRCSLKLHIGQSFTRCSTCPSTFNDQRVISTHTLMLRPQRFCDDSATHTIFPLPHQRIRQH